MENDNLRCRIEESAIAGLELAVSNKNAVLGLHALRQSSGLARTESEGIDSIRTGEEMSSSWVFLDVLPAGVRPSAGYEL